MMSVSALHIPTFGKRTSQPMPPTTQPTQDTGQLELLKPMFPDVEADVLLQMLAFNNGDAERVIDILLSDAVPQESVDAEMARCVHNTLQQELKAEAVAKRKALTDPVKAMSTASDKAKAFLSKATKPAQAKPILKAGHISSASLLSEAEAPLQMSPLEAFQPLQVPAYRAPAPAAVDISEP